METLLTVLIGAMAGAIPGIIAWWLNRKKTKADTADVLVGTAMEMMENLKQRVKELEKEQAELKNEQKRQGIEIEKLRKGAQRLINQIRQLGHEPAWTLEEMDNNKE